MNHYVDSKQTYQKDLQVNKVELDAMRYIIFIMLFHYSNMKLTKEYLFLKSFQNYTLLKIRYSEQVLNLRNEVMLKEFF